MSDYGKLWAEVSEIRQALKVLVPAISTNSLTEARPAAEVNVRELRTQADRVERLMRRWESLEAAMARCDGETGMRRG